MHVSQHEMDTIIFSNFAGVLVFPHLEDVQTICLHIDFAYAFYLLYLCCANCVVNKNEHFLDDVLPYHAQTNFASGFNHTLLQREHINNSVRTTTW
jgi:hypothetical protein